jgi:NTE family protein
MPALRSSKEVPPNSESRAKDDAFEQPARPARAGAKRRRARPELPGQVVLVLQGGGALGAYQGGVYEALVEAGIEPDWVIGTSIGAINAALIAANHPRDRLSRLRDFWTAVEQTAQFPQVGAIMNGIPSFFSPRGTAWNGILGSVGLDAASYYSVEPLRQTLGALIDPALLHAPKTRLTVGAVHVRTGEMHYFDSRREPLDIAHVLASGALPPAFPAVRINGEPYWDGGLYSNTPVEAVFNDVPRRSSLVFAVNVWQPSGPEPESIWQVMARQKDIQYASRDDSHVATQKQIHRLRHVIRELAKQVPPQKRNSVMCRELEAYGCGTTMHLVRLLAPALDSEDLFKDIDFSRRGIHSRWQAGLADTQGIIARRPWDDPFDPIEGVIVHEVSARVDEQGHHVAPA